MTLIREIEQLLPEVAAACVVLIVTWCIANIAHYIIVKMGSKLSVHQKTVVQLLGTAIKVILWLVGIVTALGAVGLNISALVASLGLSGFALSFALKDTLSNTLAGILVMIYQPFKIQDKIKVQSFTGVVEKIDLRYTTLKNDNGDHTLIPNSIVLNQPVVLAKMS